MADIFMGAIEVITRLGYLKLLLSFLDFRVGNIWLGSFGFEIVRILVKGRSQGKFLDFALNFECT